MFLKYKTKKKSFSTSVTFNQIKDQFKFNCSSNIQIQYIIQYTELINIYIYDPSVVQNLSSEIVQQTKTCVSIFKECKGMEDEAVAYVER